MRTDDASSINYLLIVITDIEHVRDYEQLGRKSNKVTVFI